MGGKYNDNICNQLAQCDRKQDLQTYIKPLIIENWIVKWYCICYVVVLNYIRWLIIQELNFNCSNENCQAVLVTLVTLVISPQGVQNPEPCKKC